MRCPTKTPPRRTNKGFYPTYPALKIRKVEVPSGNALPFGAVKIDSWIEPGAWYWAMEALRAGLITGFWMHPKHVGFKFKVDLKGSITYRPDLVVTTNTDIMEQFCQWERWDMPSEMRGELLPGSRKRDNVYLIELKGSVAFGKGMVMKPFKPKQTLLRDKGIIVNLVFPDWYEKNKRKCSGLYQQTFCPTALSFKLNGERNALWQRSAGSVHSFEMRNTNRTKVRVVRNSVTGCNLGCDVANGGEYLVSNWIDGTIMLWSPSHRYYHTLRANAAEPWIDVRGRHGWGFMAGTNTHQQPVSFASLLAKKKGVFMLKGKGKSQRCVVLECFEV